METYLHVRELWKTGLAFMSHLTLKPMSFGVLFSSDQQG